mmetsp:Transcript_35247/g.88651  ORF Transcript_35247/g.88651 Transcript_35247/m.88651 type:complete len:92 (-) Transcript_35247:30-305(-)|eukprot:CAMPEP_0177663088 /NCGR_PEP_ID=MMETSP0447-20121125/19724_1 /TAXON_ID=0 /ORGANISM="Stygamoeba regulata, Strain BSH-02190019" /LENGTH=91 /DNA_ID=CAMNT_0019168871 /DNA_START=60 /DNA_END=335 /DNA_ORIENTATION=-
MSDELSVHVMNEESTADGDLKVECTVCSPTTCAMRSATLSAADQAAFPDLSAEQLLLKIVRHLASKGLSADELPDDLSPSILRSTYPNILS